MTSLSRLLPGFRPLSKHISVGDRANELDDRFAPSTTAPESIFILTWADAAPRAIVKYVQGYRTLYPSAKIIVVQRTTLGAFFASQNAARRVVQRLITDQMFNTTKPQNGFLRRPNGHRQSNASSPSPSETKTPRNLVHIFSNSGGITLEAICNSYSAVYHTPLPIEMLILDSSPGGESWRNDWRTWYFGAAAGFGSILPTFLPKLVIRILAFAMALPLVTLLYMVPCILGFESLPARGRRVINDPNKIPVQSKRLYIYSDKDPLVHPPHVESHALNAKKLGHQSIRMEKFAGSTHVGHMRKDPERYWKAIEEVWDDSVDANDGKKIK